MLGYLHEQNIYSFQFAIEVNQAWKVIFNPEFSEIPKLYFVISMNIVLWRYHESLNSGLNITLACHNYTSDDNHTNRKDYLSFLPCMLKMKDDRECWRAVRLTPDQLETSPAAEELPASTARCGNDHF